MRVCIAMREHHSLSTEGTHFRSANIERIAMVRQERQGNVGSIRCESITQTSAIDEKWQIVFLAHGLNLHEFRSRIKCAIFRWEGDIDHAREDNVLVCFITIEPDEQSTKVGSRNLAILLRKGNHFVSAKFNGTTFVGGDMRCFSRPDRIEAWSQSQWHSSGCHHRGKTPVRRDTRRLHGCAV